MEAMTPANIEINQTGGKLLNFTTAVLPDGSVPTTVSKELRVDIINKDNKPAEVLITLVNPKTGEKGLPEDLQNAYVDVYWKSPNGETKYLFTDGKFTSGKTITLDVASAITGYIGVTLHQAPQSTFADNKTYTITVYFVQPKAGDYVQSVTYTLST